MSDESTAVQRGAAAGQVGAGSVDGLRARLIASSSDEQRLTNVRREAAGDALLRGLREYLEPAAINWNGALLRWARTGTRWGSTEEGWVPEQLPALIVVAPEPMEYDATNMSPRPVRVEGTDLWLRRSSEIQARLQLQVWARSDTERGGLVALVQDMLEPNDWMTGTRLELPYYFGARATYEKLDITYLDAVADPMPWRRADIAVLASVPELVPVGQRLPGRVVFQTELEPQAQLPGTQIEGVVLLDVQAGPRVV